MSITKIIFITIIFYTALPGVVFAQQTNPGVKLVLSSSSDTVRTDNPFFKFQTSYINNSGKRVFFVPRKRIKTLSYDYIDLIITKDGKPKYLRTGSHIHTRIARRSDFQKINPNDSFSISYEIDFRKLTDSSENTTPDFGLYSIYVFYEDKFAKRACYIKQLTSNKLAIFYKKKL